MRAGKLRERVTIEQRTLADDGMGGQSATWSTLATVWASVVPNLARARESLAVAGNQVQSRTIYDVRIRYREDITNVMRLLWRGNTLEIESVLDPNQRKSELVLMCAGEEAQP